MESLLIDFSLISDPLAYFVIFLGMLIEGDATLFIAAFLAFQGYFRVDYVTGIAILGVLVRDSFWHWLGYKLSVSHHWIDRWSRGVAEPFDKHISERPLHSMLIAKFVYGLHLAIIMRSGAIKLPRIVFYFSDMVAILVWIAIILTLAYVSAVSFFAAKSYLKFVEIALLIALVIYGVLHHLAAHYSRKSLRD